MIWLAAGVLLLVLAVGGASAFAQASVTQVKAGLAVAAAVLGVLVVAVLLISGRAGQVVWALALFGPVLWRWWRSRRPPSVSGTDPGEVVETAMLAMRLDPGTGVWSGQVRSGAQAGRDLTSLTLAELRGLIAEAAGEDPESLPLLEAWADRAHPGWRQAGGATAGEGVTDRAQAFAILGLPEGAGEAEIRAAHARLMRTAHPDAGGSDWLAARLNMARDLLLG